VTSPELSEERLSGGFVEGAVRRGDLVLKHAPVNPDFTGNLLDMLEESRAGLAPGWRGLQADGRAAYTFIPGHVPWSTPDPEPRGVYGPAARRRVFGMIRRLHDITAGSDLAAGDEVVCHGDLAYFNTVYRPLRNGFFSPVAFIDWDQARPGTRLEDVAHAVWQFLSLGDPGTDQWVRKQPRLIAECCDVYGLDGRSNLIEAIIFEQQRTVDAQRAALAAGELSRTLIDSDAISKVQRMLDWTIQHRGLFASEL
jgi:hypothetical protein